MTPLSIAITTSCRIELLDKTLWSLSRCIIPSNLDAIFVAENGPKVGVDALLQKYTSYLPLRYCYTKEPNKSIALNAILNKIEHGFVIYFDDDVRFHPKILQIYSRAVGNQIQGVFYGGRCLVDCVELPPDWLRPYLPPSVNGWDLGDQVRRLKSPDALGANWGAFACDIKAVGGFDEQKGPGSRARGQETDMQSRLLARGVAGYYLPDTIVWHFVPRERCSPEWALERVYQMAVAFGMTTIHSSRSQRSLRALFYRLKLATILLRLRILGKRLRPSRYFYCQYHMQRLRGILEGMGKLLRPEDGP